MSDPLNLNIDINDHDASRKVLPEGTYPGVVKEAVFEQSKKVPGNWNLKVTVATTTDNTSTTGVTLGAGYPVSRWFPLQASPAQIEKGMEDNWKDDITNLVDGLFKTQMGSRPAFNQELVTQMSGIPVMLNVRVEDDPNFGLSNNITKILAQ